MTCWVISVHNEKTVNTVAVFQLLPHPPTVKSKVKIKVFPYSLPIVGTKADPGEQAVSQQVT